MQDNNDEYYLYLNTIDRIEDEKKSQHIKDCEMNRRLGLCLAYWGSMVKVYRDFNIDLVKRIAKALNVDCRYLLEGTPKKEYKDVELNMCNLSSYMYKKRLHVDSSTKVILSRVRHGKQKTLRLSTYHRLNEITKGNLYSILTGEN